MSWIRPSTRLRISDPQIRSYCPRCALNIFFSCRVRRIEWSIQCAALSLSSAALCNPSFSLMCAWYVSIVFTLRCNSVASRDAPNPRPINKKLAARDHLEVSPRTAQARSRFSQDFPKGAELRLRSHRDNRPRSDQALEKLPRHHLLSPSIRSLRRGTRVEWTMDPRVPRAREFALCYLACGNP